MPLLVTKDYFPATFTCHNCERKNSVVKTDTDLKEEYKRCAGCHLLSYCDKNCQAEHWTKVHKKHCRFLSGKTVMENAKHNAFACATCIDQKQASPTQLRSEKSPKTICNVKEVIIGMKKALSDYFNFHGDGKKCGCSLNFGLELPFPLGEVSGQYVEIASTGHDAMLAHTLKILAAMTIKAQKEEHKNALRELWFSLIEVRSRLWHDILVYGMPLFRSLEYLSDQVNSLHYWPSNPWWKTLKFSVNFAMKTNRNLCSNLHDSHLEDPRFQKLKLSHECRKSQLQDQAVVTEKKTWANFMLWPQLDNDSLAVLLPPGTRCQSCHSQLGGDVAVMGCEVTLTDDEEEVELIYNSKTLPILLPEVSDNGALMACCSVAKDPSCLENCLSNDVEFEMLSNEEQRKKLLKEVERFEIGRRDCDFCLKKSLYSHRCSACLAVQYCSTVCQMKDLDFHKSVCATWAKDESRKIFSRRKQKDYRKSFLGKY